ncbi:hypothetical protein BURK2_04304 [Burkholderiales bacterium]|nr:MAG: hypothetical protein F9K47_15325 [Burkholderiales bacterium]CAG1011574.1 hypothetical protein BURK2_04304 [Burkholderiales bacterium]
MTTVKLTPQRSRGLAVALLILLLLFVMAVFTLPTVLLYQRYDAALDEFSTRLDRFQRMAAQGPEYSRTLEAVKARQGRRFFLKATAVNLAGAELQELVRSAVESNGGRLGSIQIGQAREEADRRRIPVSVQLVANVQALQRILHALETQTPYLFVENLSLRTSVFRGFRPTPGVEPEINVQLDVSGYLARSGN